MLRTDNEGDLELLDTVTNGHELAGSPEQTVLLDGANGGLKGSHIGFIVPRLNIHGHDRLIDDSEPEYIVTQRRLRHTLATVLGLLAFFAL